MADEKISAMALLAAGDVDAATDYIPIIDASEVAPADQNKRILVNSFTSGRNVNGTSFTVTGSTVPVNGAYLPAANTVGIATNTTLRLSVSTSAVTSTLPIRGAAGALGAPSFTNPTGVSGMWFSDPTFVDLSAGAHRSLLLKNSNASDAAYLEIDSGQYNSADEVDFVARGSSTNIGLFFTSKGTGPIDFLPDNGSLQQFGVTRTASAANWLTVTGAAAAGAGPSLYAVGNDSNIDIRILPKGTGLVRFGTFAANALLTPTGSVAFKLADGTTKYIMVTDAP